MLGMTTNIDVAARQHRTNDAELAGTEMRCGVCKGTFSNHNLLCNEEDETAGIICPCCGAVLHVDSSLRINTPAEWKKLGSGNICWPS